MNILLAENINYNINDMPDEIDDLRFCILDCSDVQNIDYFFLPLVFLESFTSPVAILNIGPYKVEMPLDWSVVICDSDTSDIEVMELTKLNDRGFEAFVFNPLSDTVSNTYEITITNVYPEVKCFFPKLKNGTILVVPLEASEKPKCALFVKEISKLPKLLELADLI